MTWLSNIQSSTPELYQFKLISETETIICNLPPLEWKSGTLEMKRDLESGGVFSSFQADSLTFVGNGADMLKKLFDAYEVNAKCTLVISYWKNFDTVPANGRQYVEFPTRFDVNFNFYEKVKIGRFYFGVRVKAINSSVQTKLDNRKDIEVDISKISDIGKIITIGGVVVDAYGVSDIDLHRKINFDATNVSYRAELFKNYGSHSGVLLDRVTGSVTYTSMPVNKINSEFAEVQDVAYQTKISSISAITPFFKEAKYAYNSISIYYHWNTLVTQKHIGTYNWTIQILETDPNGVIFTTHYEQGFGGLNQYYSDEGTINISIQKGNSLKFVCKNQGIDNTTAYTEIQELKITQQTSQSPAVQLEGFPLYEATERVCQHILDVRYPIYSEFLGRTDVVYSAKGTKYSAENALRFAHVQGGMNLRGASLGNEDAPLALNFKKLFASLKALYNVGYSLEVVESETRIRIEEYSHFFQNTEIVFNPPLSSRISKYDIQSQVMPELIPIDIKSGFDSYEYLTANGRSEPNTTSQHTSIMNTATKWENISPYRADTKGILDNISNPIGQNGSTDTKGDSSVFIVKTRKHATSEWIPEKGELISIIEDTSLFKNDLMNRYYTPTRMLLRNGNRLSCGMTKAGAQSSSLRFQKSDKLCSLVTSDDGGVTKLAENSDIPVSSLGTPIYKAMKHTIIVPWYFADTVLLQSNPLGYIRFSAEISGYLLSFKKKNAKDEAEITIIERP